MRKLGRKRYAGIIGIGFLYIWACAALIWVDLWNSGKTFGEIAGFFGIALVCLSGIAIVFYTSALEQESKDLSKRLEIYEASASYWESQANKAFDEIESYTREAK